MEKTRKEKQSEDVTPPVDDILTQDQLEKETKPEDKIPPVEKKKKVSGDIFFECPYAPMGESQTIIRFKFGDKEIKHEIKMLNKRYKYPKDLEKKFDVALRQALKDNGFTDVSKLDAGMAYDKNKKAYIYSAYHCEHTPDNPINGNISLAMYDEAGRPVCGEDGKQISKQVSIVNGKVETDDKLIYEALLKAGFRSGYKKVKEE